MLQTYRCLTILLFPIAQLLIFFRAFFNKEDKLRFKEKIFSSAFKPNRNFEKKLYWFHVASVGELMSILPLIEELNSSTKNIEFLITSVTLSSSRLLERKLGQYDNITHRFFPLDTEELAGKFLDAWKPDLVFFVDSEIWPNFLFKIKKNKIPLILINGRITKKTYNKWKIFPSFAKEVFNNFDLCLAASEESKKNLEKLQVKNLIYIGNLKFSVKNKIEKLHDSNITKLNKFKTWCAASTHMGEELIVLKSHIEIKKKYNNILTVIIPRHINRVSYIKKLSKKFNLNSQILNENDSINEDVEILIINSFGFLSKYFSYCKNIFIGKSFIKKLKLVGGQNPIEAAMSGCKIFHGPYVYNFKEVYDLLKLHGFSCQVDDEKDLSEKIVESFENPTKIYDQQVDFLNNHGKNIMRQTIKELSKFIN
tara:strand:- start:1016 stop:2287 length:1272 start_codon:yes stop_codon:yes gene_type:complete